MENLFILTLPIIKSIALALVTLVVGLAIIKRFSKFLENRVKKSHIDNTLKPFISSVVSTILKVLLGISVVKILGIDTTSFVAVLASAGLAIGLAFQGTLSNFAGGVLLLTLRPFRVGDFIEANGYTGTVESIQVLYTNIITVDNKVVFVPNGSLSNASIINYSVKDTRRVDLKFGVGYDTDTNRVQEVLKEIVAEHALVLKDPEPFVRMSEHGDSAIVFTVRVWVKSSDYWTVHFDLIENVKNRFFEENISIPFPQMDVHLNKE